MDMETLMKAALECGRRAYAPYSGFKVGAAIATQDGRTFCGCNVENSSFGLTLCAERAAVAAAVAAGETRFARLVLVTEGHEPTPPCGACRQVLAEFAPQLEIVSVAAKGQQRIYLLQELLPQPFGKFHVERDV